MGASATSGRRLLVGLVPALAAGCLVLWLAAEVLPAHDPLDRSAGQSAPASPAAGAGPTIPVPGVARPASEAMNPGLRDTPVSVQGDRVKGSRAPAPVPVPSWRTGQTARLRGSVTPTAANGIPARLEFLVGTNRGEVVPCGPDGEFDRGGLYPGLAVVRVTVAGGPDCVREVRLHHLRTTRLQLEVGDFGAVAGRVCDDTGAPVATASVSLDGCEDWSDAGGHFMLPRRYSGPPLLVVRHPGHASHRVLLNGASAERPVEVVLRRACSLEVTVSGVGSSGAEAQVYLLPQAGGVGATAAGLQPDYPWSLMLPVRVLPGTSAVLDDLPAGRADLVVIHPFARQVGGRETVWLDPDRPTRAQVGLEPVPVLRGRVRRDGRPVAGARVALQAENPMRATVAAFGQAFKSVPVELPPAGFQRTVTDGGGRFVLAAWSEAERSTVTVDADGSTLRITLGRGLDELEIDLDREGRVAAAP